MRIDLVGLTKTYGSTRALAGLDLQISPGTITAVIGLNGAGKTTLLRALAGLVSPTRGEIRYDDQIFMRARLDLRRRLMFLPDFPAAYAQMDCVEHLAMVLRAYERTPSPEEEARIVAHLGELDLLGIAKHPLGTLSRGQFYKVALTALLAVSPELWLLDEPFASGMDPQGLAVFKHHARAAAKGGATVLYTTQILEIAERFCDRLLVLDHGELRLDIGAAEIAAMPKDGPDSLESRLREFRDPAA